MLATLDGDVNACRLLINSNCNVNYQNSFGFTALMYAVRDGFIEIVKLLLERGADPSLCGKSGYSPLICAAQNGYTGIVEILARYSPVNVCDDDGHTPLMCACSNGHLDTACLLLRLGADPFQVDKKQRTAITHCIDNRSLAILSLFLQEGICPCYDIEGYSVSALYVSALRGHRDLVRLLMLYFFCIDDFVSYLVMYPNVTVEGIILQELERMKSILTVESVSQLSDYLSSYVIDFLHLLMSSYEGAISTLYPLCGIVEACVWCLHCIKLLNGPHILPNLYFYLDYVESVISEAAIAYEEFLSVSLDGPDENSLSSLGEPFDTRQIKLLFSLIEVYCVMCGSVIHDLASYKERSSFRLNDRSRLFLEKNCMFLK